MRIFLVNFVSLLVVTAAPAGLLHIKYTSGTGIFAVPAIGQSALDSIADEVNKQLPSAEDQDAFVRGMSNANAIAAAGATTSYATPFEHFLAGLIVSGGVALGKKSFGEIGDITSHPEQFGGFGIQPGIIVGVNGARIFGGGAGFIDPNRLSLYLSGLVLNHDFGQLQTKYYGIGIGGKYAFASHRPHSGASVQWTGWEVGASVLYSRLDLDANIDLNQTYNGTYNGQPISGTTTNTNAFLSAKIDTFTVPLEISTGVCLFHFLKFIAGAGMDLSFGNTTGHGNLSPGSTFHGEANGGINSVDGNADLSLDASGGPDVADLRLFAGPHIEFGAGSVFFNFNKSITQNSVALNTGLNVYW